MPRQVKIAVVGSGLAGLTATYILNNVVSRDTDDVQFEVHLFEKASTLGMDCSSVSVPASASDALENAWRVDVPMRSFQGGYYPQLIALYTRLGVAFREANFTYSFSLLTPASHAQDRQINATMIYNGSSGRAGLNYIWLTLATHHYVVVNGVREVVAKLTATTRNIHLASTITTVSPDPQDHSLIEIKCDTPEGSKTHSGFHHIIFATQASRAVPLLASYRDSLPSSSLKRHAVEAQLQCLQQFKYCSTIVVNHTDPTLLPDHERDQRDLNLICLDQDALPSLDKSNFGWSTTTVPPTYTMATHVLRRPEGYPTRLPAVFQTTNPIISPKEESILSVVRLDRAVLSLQSKEALKGLYQKEGRGRRQRSSQESPRLGELQGAGRLRNVEGPGIWICGSYVYSGIPLLEGCVVSARTVVEQGVYVAEGVVSTSAPW
ncbi:hypothetical protein H0H93_013082 [Arthromyces matolae]|nr:hypothetical protein H0H93_013082 [Arthromyces matolae]